MLRHVEQCSATHGANATRDRNEARLGGIPNRFRYVGLPGERRVVHRMLSRRRSLFWPATIGERIEAYRGADSPSNHVAVGVVTRGRSLNCDHIEMLGLEAGSTGTCVAFAATDPVTSLRHRIAWLACWSDF